MGTFLFNLHLRTDDQARVLRALTASGLGLPALVSTAVAGWVSVYPSGADDDDPPTIARHLSKELGCLAISFQVYDSDACFTSLFKRGVCFARDKRNDENPSKRGKLERFAKYALAKHAESLAKALQSEPVLAEEIAFQIGKAFGVAHAHLDFSYAWWKQGEAKPTDSVEVEKTAASERARAEW